MDITNNKQPENYIPPEAYEMWGNNLIHWRDELQNYHCSQHTMPLSVWMLTDSGYVVEKDLKHRVTKIEEHVKVYYDYHFLRKLFEQKFLTPCFAHKTKNWNPDLKRRWLYVLNIPEFINLDDYDSLSMLNIHRQNPIYKEYIPSPLYPNGGENEGEVW